MKILPQILAGLILTAATASAFSLPRKSTQCVVGIADHWNSSKVSLAFFEKTGGKWVQAGSSWPGRLGKSGLVWGLGIHPVPKGANLKTEGDWRSPAGVFRIGGVWGYTRDIQRCPALAYRQVTPRDLWIEDPASPDYNRNIVLDHIPATAWEKKQQMKQADPAHAIKLFIAHNPPPKVVRGAGSSIFFHIWRGGGSQPTAGCTTMDESKLRWLIARLDPARKPLFVLLTKDDYNRYRQPWGLP
ncbi:MAG: L,D-transpeptidase family protein [Verrucomicrobiota bacterium]